MDFSQALRLFVARVDALDALRTAQPRGRSAAAVDASVRLRAFAERFLAELREEWDTNGVATHAAHHLGRRAHGIMTCLDLPSLRGVLLADVTPELCEQVLRGSARIRARAARSSRARNGVMSWN